LPPSSPERAGDRLPLSDRFGYDHAVHDTAGADDPEAQEIAERLAAGDPEAVAWLYDAVAPDLYRRLKRRYGYPGGPDAADLLQETFLLSLRDGARLLRGALATQPAGAPALPELRRYLWDLACGVAANVRRSVWSRRAVPMPETALAAGEPPTERSAVARDALARLAGCLAGQGERLYLYFKLRYVDGLTPEETAAATGWSRKATYKLRQSLNEAVERCLDRLGLRPATWLSAIGVVVLLAVTSTCRGQPPLLPVQAVVRGHREVLLLPAGRPRPLVVGRHDKVGLCFAVPAGDDTSRWEAVLTFAGEKSPTGFAAAVRAGPTLCFDGAVPPRLRAASRIALCGRLIDRFDGTLRGLPCREIAYQPDSGPLERVDAGFHGLVAARPSLTLDEFLRRLDALAATARSALPLTAARLQLIAVHFLTQEGTLAALAAARDRLARLPEWLGDDAALVRSAQAAYQRGRLALASGSRGAAWLAFEDAAERAVRIADPTLLPVVLQQADLLAQAGAPEEALARVANVLGAAPSLGCDPEIVLDGRLQLAWLTLLHVDATPEQLAHARSELLAALPGLAAAGDPYEAANQRINLAYLELRTGGDPRPWIAEARRLVSAPGTGRVALRTLAGWSSLLAGLGALARGEAAAALAECSAIATADPQLAAARASCQGRAHRAAGDLAAAARAFDAALKEHERVAAALDQRLPLGPGERAEDFARAARVAVERGDPGAAWGLLLRLDSLSAQERERDRCRELARGEEARRWAAIERESASLRHELRSLPRLAESRRERQAADLRVTLEERLRRLWREWPGCAAPAPADDSGVDLRAFAVEDEVVLLGRDRAGRVEVERRTRWPRRERLAALRALAAEIEAGDIGHAGHAGNAGHAPAGDLERWRAKAAPLAAAVLPRHPEALGAVTTYALHGALQLLPLAAMPLPTPFGGRRFLGEMTTVAIATAGARAAASGGGPAQQPVFVVDPTEDLGGAERSLAAYRRWFPDSRVLRGAAATRAAVRGALAGALWLHVDAHASYDPVFPEMSQLELADGALSLMEWSRLPAPRRFANLSGCRTASWPTTADSGQYGLGGLLTRLGAGWVVATRGPIPDDAAFRYNQEFYGAIAAGATVPAAHAAALAALRARQPPRVWGVILLLHAAGTAGALEGGKLPRRSLLPDR
jgi:DNA-directed RNA polymerase specialized sigma24 family protein